MHEIFYVYYIYFQQICGYPDDMLVIARGLPALEAMCAEISSEAVRVGLVISPNKSNI